MYLKKPFWFGYRAIFFSLLAFGAQATGFQLEPQGALPESRKRLKSLVGAWEGAGQMAGGERLHQLLVIDRRDGAFVAEMYHFRFPKDAVAVALEAPQISGNKIHISAANFPGRFEGQLNRETGQMKGRWIWRETPLDPFVLGPLKRGDVNRVRYPLGKPPGQKIKLKYKKPRKAELGLPVTALNATGLRWQPLQKFLRRIVRGEFGRMHGVLIAHRNRLVLEQYFYGFNSSDLHEIRSVQKGFVALLVMKLVDEGLIANLDQPIQGYFSPTRTAQWQTEGKSAITLRHLLTMTSGLDAVQFGAEPVVQNQANPDWVDYMLDAPLKQQPGKRFFYHSTAMNLLVAIAEKVTGKKAQKLLEMYFFEPMGIGKTHFYHDPSGRLYGAGGGAMRPRDMLKLGLMIQNNGRFAEKRLLSSQAVQQLFSPTVENLPFRESDLRYGLLWYVRDFNWPEGLVRTYQARGAGGQMIVVIPAWEMTWVLTGGNYLDMTHMQPAMLALMEALKEANKNLAGLVSQETP